MSRNCHFRHLFIALSIISSSCETVVDIDIPAQQSQVVMNSLLNPDSAWSVNLTLSEHVLNKDTTRFISNAEVSVYDENEHLVVKLSYDKRGNYRSNESKPEGGKFYTIVAMVPNYKTVEGSTVIPNPPEILDATSRLHLFEFKLSGSYTVEFLDDPTGDNYYEVFMQETTEINEDSVRITKQHYTFSIYSDDPNVNTEILDVELGLMFADKLFQGKNIKLHVKSEEGTYGPSLTSSATRVLVRSVTKEYYDYARSLKLQFKSSSDPLAQPVEVRSNIKNGLGLVAGIAQSKYIVDRPIPKITSIIPSSARRGDTIIIEGENLDGEFSNTVVYFNIDPSGNYSTVQALGIKRVSGQIIERSPTSLAVIVPTLAITNRILIHAFGRFKTSDEKFIVIQ